MQISDTEVKKLLHARAVVAEIVEIGEERTRAEDAQLVEQVKSDVMGMGDREDRIAELKAKIESGAYNPTGDEIAEAMVRRAIADRIQ